MSPTPYQVGRRFEYQTRDLLRAKGFYVIRSAGSKTKVDLIAVGEPIKIEDAMQHDPDHMRAMLFSSDGEGDVRAYACNTLYVQCKRDGRISPAERDELIKVAFCAGARPCVAEVLAGKLVIREIDSAGQRMTLEV